MGSRRYVRPVHTIISKFIFTYSADFLKTNLRKFSCSHLSEKASKGMFLKPDKLQTDYYIVTNKKERRKRKSIEKRKK